MHLLILVQDHKDDSQVQPEKGRAGKGPAFGWNACIKLDPCISVNLQTGARQLGDITQKFRSQGNWNTVLLEETLPNTSNSWQQSKTGTYIVLRTRSGQGYP